MINPEIAPKELDYTSMMRECFVDVKKTISKPPIALSFGEHSFAGNYYPTPFATYGNFSCLVGASKSMKTFLKSALVASYIGGKANTYFPSAKGFDTQDKYVIDFDTEQSDFHTHRAANRVCQMIGGMPDFYVPLSFRPKSPKERLGFLEWLFMESNYRNNLGFIAVDGAADLLMDANSLEQANEVTNAYLKWTKETNSHLLTVIHRNFDSNKATGHLGSAITKKAETVAIVEYDKQSKRAMVKAQHTRNIAFENFCFELNENHLPVEVEENLSI